MHSITNHQLINDFFHTFLMNNEKEIQDAITKETRDSLLKKFYQNSTEALKELKTNGKISEFHFNNAFKVVDIIKGQIQYMKATEKTYDILDQAVYVDYNQNLTKTIFIPLHRQINRFFTGIIEARKESDRKKINTAPDKLEEAKQLKNDIINEMKLGLRNMKLDEALYARVSIALEFYKNSIEPIGCNPDPSQCLSELVAIDYSQDIQIITIPKDCILTQMQRPNLDIYNRPINSHGSYFSEGKLPGNYDQRANKVGIGIKSVDIESNTLQDKSIYMVKVYAPTQVLASYANRVIDSWSVSTYKQIAQGGDVQMRISTKDYFNVGILEYGQVKKEEFHMDNKGDKILKNGFILKNFRSENKSTFAKKVRRFNQSKTIPSISI